jgi:hypothetical protein
VWVLSTLLLLALGVHKVLREIKAHKVLRGHRETKVRKVTKGRRELVDIRET